MPAGKLANLVAVQQPTGPVRLRKKRYEAYCALQDLSTQAEQAQAFRVSAPYLGRVLRGEREVGTQLIAGVLTGLEGVTFEDVFEMVVDDQPQRRSA